MIAGGRWAELYNDWLSVVLWNYPIITRRRCLLNSRLTRALSGCQSLTALVRVNLTHSWPVCLYNEVKTLSVLRLLVVACSISIIIGAYSPRLFCLRLSELDGQEDCSVAVGAMPDMCVIVCCGHNRQLDCMTVVSVPCSCCYSDWYVCACKSYYMQRAVDRHSDSDSRRTTQLKLKLCTEAVFLVAYL